MLGAPYVRGRLQSYYKFKNHPLWPILVSLKMSVGKISTKVQGDLTIEFIAPRFVGGVEGG